MALLDLVLLKSRLGLLAGRFDVDAVDTCDSTSSELLRRAEQGAPAGAVVVADRQTAGRGRRGRTWLSVPGESLTFSLLWRFACPSGGLAGLSLAVGVALAQGLEALGAGGICLKWPNDVLLRCGDDFAKLAGVLVELASDAQGTQAVIGIGLNLRPPRADLPQPAAGLDQALASQPDRGRRARGDPAGAGRRARHFRGRRLRRGQNAVAAAPRLAAGRGAGRFGR